MRIHGWVLLTVHSLSRIAFAQGGDAESQPEFLPPSPRSADVADVTPPPLPAPVKGPAAEPNIEAELLKFRSELREFQTLREEVARGAKSMDLETERSATHQRQELLDLITKLAKQGMARKAAGSPAATEPATATKPTAVDSPNQPTGIPVLPVESIDIAVTEIADPFALGKVLFRAGDFVGAERAFRKAHVSSENEMMLKYLLATCQRRQSKWQAAIDGYKAVSESNQDPVLRDLAKWQIDNIRWHQQSEAQLEQMRLEREKRAKATLPSASAGTRRRQ